MNTKELFTLDGREVLRERLKKLCPKTNWLVATRGFIDHDTGLPVTDTDALDILLNASTTTTK
jgi:hypothetical protein